MTRGPDYDYGRREMRAIMRGLYRWYRPSDDMPTMHDAEFAIRAFSMVYGVELGEDRIERFASALHRWITDEQEGELRDAIEDELNRESARVDRRQCVQRRWDRRRACRA
ncbi:hypothetical protein [Burkholderia sp. BCC1988]|uniref:hypothetical protein n=1 Tax=Burkholderia sp. BCC1988 TaxID=2817443 RepID=UPI002AB0E708|nr:hypothetical protein [Burkholderia sp. BCC1988]